MLKDKISVIIPAFNEEDNILNTINETIKVLENINNDYEIIIIDDGSNDDTYKKVTENILNFNGKVIIKKYLQNEGKGYAIKYGANFVTGGYVLFLDADLDLPPDQIINFIRLMNEGKADVIIGSKMHKDSVLDYPKIRKFYSFMYYILIKILFGLPVKDTQTGLKLFKAEVFKKAISKIVIKRYAFDLELLVVLHKMGYKIIECPVILKSTRKYGRIGLKDAFNIFNDTLAIFYRLYIKKYYKN